MDKPTSDFQVWWDHSEMRLTIRNTFCLRLLSSNWFSCLWLHYLSFLFKNWVEIWKWMLHQLCKSLICLARFPLLVEAYSQTSHWNGFSPVCVRMCCLTWNGDTMTLEQNGQAQERSRSLIGSFCKTDDFQK